MTVLKYIFNASFSDGPSESIKEELWLNTYDVVTIKVAAGEEKKGISILPPNTSIKFFCITSDQYGENDKVLKYVIKSNATTPIDIPIVLDRPHVMIGKSILDEIGNFSKIDIDNKTGPESNLRILFARDLVNS